VPESFPTVFGSSLIQIESGGSGSFEKISFNSFSSSVDGSIINGVIGSAKQLVIKGCSFTSISSNSNGGALYIELESGGNFEIGNSVDSTPSSFSSCTATNGKGGGIYLKLESVTARFSLSGGLSFTNCDAVRGKNIYIESDDLENIDMEWSTSFNYNYESSLLLSNATELSGGISSSDVDLRIYLCSLQSYTESGYFILYFFLFCKYR
jgi:hypothetical protein